MCLHLKTNFLTVNIVEFFGLARFRHHGNRTQISRVLFFTDQEVISAAPSVSSSAGLLKFYRALCRTKAGGHTGGR